MLRVVVLALCVLAIMGTLATAFVLVLAVVMAVARLARCLREASIRLLRRTAGFSRLAAVGTTNNRDDAFAHLAHAVPQLGGRGVCHIQRKKVKGWCSRVGDVQTVGHADILELKASRPACESLVLSDGSP